MRTLSRNAPQPIVFQGSRAPTVNDDRAHGIPLGTLWLDMVTTPVVLYISADDTPGAAVWVQPTGGGGGGGLTYIGTWSSVTTYNPQDVVSYAGGSYVALTTNTNVVPTSLAPNWGLLATPGLTQATADTLYRAIGSYIFTQGSAASTWTIMHNLGTYPNVQAITSAHQQIEGDVVYVDTNTLTITFNAAYSGTAILT